MYKEIKTIILNSYSYDEYDKVVIGFCKEYGIIKFYARGVSKPISKNKYSLDLFSTSELEIFRARFKDKLSKLKTGHLITSRTHLTKSYEKYLWVSFIADLLINSLSDNDTKSDYGDIFNLFTWMLNSESSKDFFYYTSYFLFYYLSFLGSKLFLSSCIKCRINNKIKTFSNIYMGFICSQCSSKEDIQYSVRVLKIIYEWSQSENINSQIPEKISILEIRDILQILINYYDLVLGSNGYIIKEIKHNSSLWN